jgi:hypothetical protein
MDAALNSLTTLRISVSQHLAGSKFAYQFGDGPVLVSPAMFDLMKHATPGELKTLLETIQVKHLPEMCLSPFRYVPLYTQTFEMPK